MITRFVILLAYLTYKLPLNCLLWDADVIIVILSSVLTPDFRPPLPTNPRLSTLRDFLFASAMSTSWIIHPDEGWMIGEGLEGPLGTSTAGETSRVGGSCRKLKGASEQAQGKI